MSVACKAVISPVTIPAVCSCPLVDFDITITGLCNHTKYGIVAVVKCGSFIVGTVCDIFPVEVAGAAPCSCVSVTRPFRKIIIDRTCCDDSVDCTLTVELACANYITGCCAV